jgi:hypothetical protein
MLVGVGVGGVVLEGVVLAGAALDVVVVAVGVLDVWHATTEMTTAAPTSAMAKVRADIRLL